MIDWPVLQKADLDNLQREINAQRAAGRIVIIDDPLARPARPVLLRSIKQRRKLSGWLAQIVGRLHHEQRIDKSPPWLGWDPSTGEFFWVPSPPEAVKP